jgi:hypothetical protein
MRTPTASCRLVLFLSALCAVCVVLASVPAGALARASGTYYDAANPNVWADLTQADRAAVEDFVYGVSRGDYTPWTAADVGGSRVPEEVGEELLRHFRSSIPPTAVGAEAAQTELKGALSRTGMWPRIWQAIGGGARSAGTKLATRAIPGVAGGFVLWEIGCAAGIGLPLCHHEKVRITRQQTDRIRFEFTGADGRCVVGDSAFVTPLGSGASATCPTHDLSLAPKPGKRTGMPAQRIPSNALLVFMDRGDGTFVQGTNCVENSDVDYTYKYFSSSPIGGVRCSLLVPPGGEDFVAVDGITTPAGKYADYEGCGFSSTGIPCFTNKYVTGSRSWYLDPDASGKAVHTPGTGTDPSWPSDGSGTPSRVTSDMPARPERGGTTAEKIGQALAEDPALRQEIVYVLNRQRPEDIAPNDWTVTQVDDGPAVGRATVPECVGVTYDACVTRMHAAGFPGRRAAHAIRDGARRRQR